MHELQVRLAWLGTFKLLEGIPNAKIKHFAAQARVLDAAEIKDLSAPKRYTLLLTMLHRTRITNRDPTRRKHC